MKIDELELKPCPFCGGEARSHVECVGCIRCGCETDDFQTEAEALEAWNKRTTQPNLLERVREFAREIIELAHEGDVDSGQVYEIGTRTGVIRIEEKTVPCVPDDETCEACCGCAEHAEHGEVVDCYRLNPELFPVCKPK